MFRQLVAGANAQRNINSLFVYHPLQIAAIVETVWLNRNNKPNSGAFSPFAPWPPEVAYPILNSSSLPGYAWPTATTPDPLLPAGMLPAQFTAPILQPGIQGTANGTSGSLPA